MDDKIKSYKLTSVSLCDKLVNELKNNMEDADLFFGGEIYKSYVEVTDTVLEKTKSLRTKIRNL